MNRSLRRRHRYMWIVLAVLLPVGFVAAWKSIPEPAVPAEGVPAGSMEVASPALTARLDADRNVLIIKVLRPLTHPNTLVYAGTGDLDKPVDGKLVGRLDTRREYRFSLPAIIPVGTEFHVLLYDPVKERIIQKIDLK